MRWHRVALGAIALVAVLVGMVLPSQVSAASAPAPAKVVFSPPAEGPKVTLPETSIDGPAMWAHPASSPINAVIAWTGTDSLHHLNYMTSVDGLSYTNKHTLNETSLWRPAVTFDSEGRAGIIVLAWTGTDPAHTLNVLYIDAYDFRPLTKLTLWGETSFTAPAIAAYGAGEVALSWAGTDAGHTVNVIRISRFRQVVGKSTYWGWSSLSRPDLNWNADRGQMLLSFTGPNHRLYFATSTDATNFTMPSTSPMAEYSNWAPSMLGITNNNFPNYWVTWTGTDAAHSVNVQYTESFPNWPVDNSKAVLSEQAISGPALAYVGWPTTSNRGYVLVGWTGVDAAHHLNVAQVIVRW